jgi:hypothetical protein
MDTLGERTLQVLVAFKALRLEYGWQRMPANSAQLNSLKGIQLN